MKIAFLLPALTLGGGNLVVAQLAKDLISFGHEAVLVSCGPASENVLSESIRGVVPVALLEEVEGREFDIAVASFWPTVYELQRLKASSYVYFVQSLEHRFYRKSERLERRAALATYELGLPVITIAEWIAAELRCISPRSPVEIVRDGVDHSIFKPEPFPAAKPFRVLVEGSLETPLKNTRLALELARASAADEVWLLAPHPVDGDCGADRVFFGLSRSGVAEVMTQCHVLLKLSLVEGLSLPPLEMALIGRPSILSPLEPYFEYLQADRSCIIVEEPFRERVLQSIDKLKRNPELLASMGAAARARAASWPDFHASALAFEKVLLSYRNLPCAARAPQSGRERWVDRNTALSILYGKESRPVPFRVVQRIAGRVSSFAGSGAAGTPSIRDYA